MTITVTAEDIQSGRRCDPDSCPVGRALRRAAVPCEGVMGAALLVPEGGGRLELLLLPREVREWIFDFDRGRPVLPISFELPVTPATEEWPPLAA